MKNLLLLFILFSGFQSIAQSNYWQQYLRYLINAKLNDKEKTITGSETIVYKNNSPETLTYIWFHIYPNAHRNQSTALSQQIKNNPRRIHNYTVGSISNLAFTVNGTAAVSEPHQISSILILSK